MGSDNGNWIEKKLDQKHKLVGDYFKGWRMEGYDDGSPVFYVSIYIEDVEGNNGQDYYCIFPKEYQHNDIVPTLAELNKRYGRKFQQLYARIKAQNKSEWRTE